MSRARTVLIIDDEAAFRKLIGEYLAGNGWSVLEAGTGDEGVELAQANRPDVIICDLLMPSGNGFQVIQALRQQASLRRSSIVVISGRNFHSDRVAALEAGADDYLVKPVDPAKLLLLLSRTVTQAPSAEAGAPDAAASPGPAESASMRFWGVRGSIPTPGPGTIKYGGNTSCVEVRAGGQIIILDAGTGLRLLGRELMKEFGQQPFELTVLLTHTHWDHIQGLPFFLPLLQAHNKVRILGFEGARQGLDSLLSSQMENPFFPIGLRDVAGSIHIEELRDLRFALGRVEVRAWFANHPGICVGYRLNAGNASVAFFPDNEPHLGRFRVTSASNDGAAERAALDHAREQHQKMIEFLRGTDALIMDAQYDATEYHDHVGWGHGCLDDVVALAIEAGVKRLFLFHHDPDHDDAKVDQMLDHACAIASRANAPLVIQAAREGAQVELG